MAPRGRKKKTGLRRGDAARDRMRVYGFEKHIIEKSIKELLKVYGEDQWFLIEDDTYSALLSVCLEKQEQQAKQLAAEEQANQLDAEEQAKQLAAAEQANHAATEEQANNAAEEMAKKEEEEKEAAGVLVSIKTEVVMDSAEKILATEEHNEMGQEEQEDEKTAGKAVMDSSGYADHSVEGAECSHCGWLSSEDEETDPDSDYEIEIEKKKGSI